MLVRRKNEKLRVTRYDCNVEQFYTKIQQKNNYNSPLILLTCLLWETAVFLMYKVVSIQVVLIRPQALKLFKNFDHFKYSLRVKKENIWVEYSSSCKPSNVKILTTRLNELVSKRPVTTLSLVLLFLFVFLFSIVLFITISRNS